jgi:hypothetical protein
MQPEVFISQLPGRDSAGAGRLKAGIKLFRDPMHSPHNFYILGSSIALVASRSLASHRGDPGLNPG